MQWRNNAPYPSGTLRVPLTGRFAHGWQKTARPPAGAAEARAKKSQNSGRLSVATDAKRLKAVYSKNTDFKQKLNSVTYNDGSATVDFAALIP